MRLFFIFILLFVSACSGQSKEELFQEGNKLRDQGNLRGAIVLYKNALEKDANYVEARFELADAYLDSGNLTRAEKEFQKVLHQKPTETEAQLKLIRIFIAQRLPEKALLKLDNYHAANSETAESAVLYGLAHGVSGDISSAESFFQKGLQLDEKSVEAMLNLAKVHLQRSQLDKAEDYLQGILAIDDSHIAAHYLLADLKSRAGKTEEALEVYQQLLRVDPKQQQALYMSGMLQMDLGALDEAQSTVDRLMSVFPKQPSAMRLKGIMLSRQGRHQEAILPLQEALKVEQHPLTFFFLGLNYFSLEQYEQALSQFQKALDINADFERARLLVAMTLMKQKRFDDAILEVKRVLARNPDSAYARNILGSAYLATGKYDEGMEELSAATELDPTLADAHLKQGIYYLATGKGELGEAGLVKAVEAAPDALNSRLMLVSHYLRQENYSAAIQTINEGMNGGPGDALLNNHLAAAFFSQKKPAEAVQALMAAKAAKPDYPTPYFNLASYYTSQSEYEKAMSEYEQVLAVSANNLRALLGMAVLNAIQGQESEVEKIFSRIEATGTEQGFVTAADYKSKKKQFVQALNIVDRGLQKYQTSALLLSLKGALHVQASQYEAAESAFLKLAESSPERANTQLFSLYLKSDQIDKAEALAKSILDKFSDREDPYLMMSTLGLRKGEAQAAVDALRDGIETVKNPVNLLLRLGQIMLSSGKIQQAEQVYLGLIDKAPRYAPAYSALASVKERSGDKGKALDLYRMAVKYDKRDVLALNNLAYLLADNFGEPKEALEHALAAYRLQPGDPRVLDTIGFVLLKNERYEDADKLLTKASEMLPDVSTVNLHAALAKKALGQTAQAKELLQKVIGSDNTEDAEQARKLLKDL